MILGRDLLILTVLVVVVKAVSNQKEITGTQRYCGRNLVNILTMVCDGIYNQMALKEGHELHKNESPTKAEPSVFRKKRSVVTIFNERSFRRQKRGAYEECCRKGCTIEEMLGYCGNA